MKYAGARYGGLCNGVRFKPISSRQKATQNISRGGFYERFWFPWTIPDDRFVVGVRILGYTQEMSIQNMRSRPNFATDPTFREASCTTAVAKHVLQHVDIAYFEAKTASYFNIFQYVPIYVSICFNIFHYVSIYVSTCFNLCFNMFHYVLMVQACQSHKARLGSPCSTPS